MEHLVKTFQNEIVQALFQVFYDLSSLLLQENLSVLLILNSLDSLCPTLVNFLPVAKIIPSYLKPGISTSNECCASGYL